MARYGATAAGAVLAFVLAAAGHPADGPVRATTELRPGPGPERSDSLVLEDDLGRTVRLAAPPRRIVSLVPAGTELIFALGAGERLVGRTRYGVHPPEAREVESVGEGLRPSLELILERRPDVVLLFASPETRETAERLTALGTAAVALRHNTLADLRRTVRRLGRLTGREAAARQLTDRIECELRLVAAAAEGQGSPRVYYEVWSDPPVTVGAGSYLDSLVSIAGGRNVFGDLRAPSSRVGLEAVAARDPDLVLVPRRQGREDGQRPARRPGWDVIPAVREGRIRSVDGDLVHRLGPRIGEAARALAAALHPDLEEELRGVRLQACVDGTEGDLRAGGAARPTPAEPGSTADGSGARRLAPAP